MKNNDDKIFKYLSELLDDKEKIEFERELKNDKALFHRYNALKNNIDNFADGDDKRKLNENYFNSLVPKVRARLDEKYSRRIKPSIIYAFSSVAAVILLVFLLNPGSSKVDFSFNEYEDEISSIISNSESNFDEVLAGNYNYDYGDINIDEISEGYYSEYIDELTLNYNESHAYQTIDINDSYELIDNLEDEEVNKIISELKEIKFL